MSARDYANNSMIKNNQALQSVDEGGSADA